MTTIDPAVLVGAVAGLVTLQLTSLGILVAVLRFFYLRLDRRFAEVRTDIDRRFTEVGTDIDRRFTEVRTDIDRRFAEVDRRFVEVQAGFAEARDDRRRLEEKLDDHGKDLARLQGIVERTYEPHRFTVGMPGPLPAAPRVVPDAPDEPPAGPPSGGRT